MLVSVPDHSNALMFHEAYDRAAPLQIAIASEATKSDEGSTPLIKVVDRLEY